MNTHRFPSWVSMFAAMVVSAAELLGDYDQIGIIAFEDQPRWILQPTTASPNTA